MRDDLRLVQGSGGEMRNDFASAPRRSPQPDPEALWNAFVEAQERSKRTLALGDGLAAGKAYAAFLTAFTSLPLKLRKVSAP